MDSPRAPQRLVVINTFRGGLRYGENHRGMLTCPAQRHPPWAVMMKTARYGTRFAQRHFDRKFSRNLGFGFDTHFDVRGITISPLGNIRPRMWLKPHDQ